MKLRNNQRKLYYSKEAIFPLFLLPPFANDKDMNPH